MTTKETASLKREARKSPGDLSNRPVSIIYGSDRAPSMEGDRAHYETRGGTWISHPTSYAKRGWSNMAYVASTREIVVGTRGREKSKMARTRKQQLKDATNFWVDSRTGAVWLSDLSWAVRADAYDPRVTCPDVAKALYPALIHEQSDAYLGMWRWSLAEAIAIEPTGTLYQRWQETGLDYMARKYVGPSSDAFWWVQECYRWLFEGPCDIRAVVDDVDIRDNCRTSPVFVLRSDEIVATVMPFIPWDPK
jgi:hypothetical protein